MTSNNNGSTPNFSFAFNDINFSDRVLRIEIERDDKVESTCNDWFSRRKSRTKTKNYDELCNIDNGIDVKNIHITSPILAEKSPFFFKLFSNGMKESEERHATLRIDSSEEVALMDLLNFMYSNTLSSSTTSSLVDVLMVADKFQVSSCMRYCTELLRKLSVTCELALELLHLPSTVLMADEVQPLLDAAKTYLVDLYKDFTRFEQEVLKLPLAGMEVVLSSNYLRLTSEDVVYDFVLKWSRKHYPVIEKRREILTTRLGSLIRFEYMTYTKLKEVPSCNDFDPAYASKVVLDALFFKAQSPDLEIIPRPVAREYKYWPDKLLQSKFQYPHCDFYLDLKKKECVNLLPRHTVSSKDFDLGGNRFYLVAKRCPIDNADVPSDSFGLFLGMRGEQSDSCSVTYKFSARSKPIGDFLHYGSNLTYTFTAGGAIYGFPNLFGVSWSQFIAADSIYFIKGVLYLKVEIIMNP